MSLSLDHEDAKPESRQKERFAAFAKMFGEGRSFSGHERNCCYLNPGNSSAAAGKFANISAASGLDYPDDARAIILLDWDQDGDLDVWASNRNAPRLRLLRNEIPKSGNFINLSLVGNGTTTNRDAIGARVKITADPSEGKNMPPLISTLRAGEGFLSQSSKWMHFGLGDIQQIDKVVVSWPGGEKEEFTNVQMNARNELKQGSGISKPLKASNREVALEQTPQQLSEKHPFASLRLITPATMPPITYKSWDGGEQELTQQIDKPTLVILWASWCQPCLKELKELADVKEKLDDAGVNVIALAVDGIGTDSSDPQNAHQTITAMKFPYESAKATEDLLKGLQTMHDRQAAVKRPLPLPTSILINPDKELVAIYKGPLQIDSLLADIDHLNDSASERVAHAAALPGRIIDHEASKEMLNIAEAEQRFKTAAMFEKYRFLDPAIVEYDRILDLWPMNSNDDSSALDKRDKIKLTPSQENKRNQIQAMAYTSRGQLQQRKGNIEAAIESFEKSIASKSDNPRIYFTLGKLSRRLKNNDEAIKYFKNVIDYDPRNADAYREWGQLLSMRGNTAGALHCFSKTLEIDPQDVSSLANRGALYASSGKYDLAIKDFTSAIKLNPNSASAYNNFAWMLATCIDPEYRDGEKATVYATKACDLLNWKSKDSLDTLAAAAAESGDFENAVKWQEKALLLDPGHSNTTLRRRLQLYKQGKKYRVNDK